MPFCSIIIPWHRDLNDLRRAVDSVLAQDWAEFEIIVVANGVADQEFSEVSALYEDRRYRAVRLEIANASIARNHGSKIATGDLLFFLDADDRFHAGKLLRFVELYRTEGFDVAFSRGHRVRKHGVRWPWPIGHWDGKRPVAEFFFCDGCTISTTAIVLAASSKEVLRFSECHRPYEDPDLIIRAEHMGLRVIMLPEPLYDYFDDRTDNRLSNALNWSERLAWIDQTPGNVSKKARAAFRARCVGQHLFPGKFFTCLGYFADALVRGAVPPRDIALFMARGFIPIKMRHALLNQYFTARAARVERRERRLRASGTTSEPEVTSASVRAKP
ncbi:MAG: glycosyltransferase family 2 protein [Hyphomicrobium sp.]